MDDLFKIFRIREEETIEIAASPDEPHQHNFEELIIGVNGTLEHFIDFQSEKVDSPCVSFITKGKVHRIIPRLKNGKSDFWVIRFKSEFISETTFQLYSFYHDNATLKMESGECFDRLVTLCTIMNTELQQESPSLSVIRHLLSALFSMIESEKKKTEQGKDSQNKIQNTTFHNFLKILEENYHRPLGVEFYAEKLFMSARNLNMICQNILNQTVSEIIETRKLIEAKNLLSGTDKSISEIGFELGYNEKSYFTNVFKKRTGQTPTEFREEMRKLIS